MNKGLRLFQPLVRAKIGPFSPLMWLQYTPFQQIITKISEMASKIGAFFSWPTQKRPQYVLCGPADVIFKY